tara:strand:- start:2349 stop:3050 length:702 start_codon:yes stop_codon:yes gene_type:complete
MAGSHSVGSLFVNIGGSTKGLSKALSSAKKKILDFSSSATSEQRAIVKSSLSNVADAARMAAVGSKSPDMGTRVQTRRQSADALRSYRGEKAKLDKMNVARAMRIQFGILGVSVAAVSMIMKHGINKGKESIQQGAQFAAIGPYGGDVISARVGAIMDKIKYAQTREGSLIQKNSAERDRRAAEVSRRWEQVANQWSEVALAIYDFFSPKRDPKPYLESQRRQETGHGRHGVG